MRPWERVVRAMEHVAPDRVPFYEMHIPPKISSQILGRPPSQVLLHNVEAFWRLATRGEADLKGVNERIAEELVELYDGLGIDWVRMMGAYTRVPRKVRRADEGAWIVDGRMLVLDGETMWDLAALWEAEARAYDPDELERFCRESGPGSIQRSSRC